MRVNVLGPMVGQVALLRRLRGLPCLIHLLLYLHQRVRSWKKVLVPCRELLDAGLSRGTAADAFEVEYRYQDVVYSQTAAKKAAMLARDVG